MSARCTVGPWQQLPKAAPLLRVPIMVIIELVSNRSEAEALIHVGELAHDFDCLMAHLAQWLEHQQALKFEHRVNDLGEASQASALLPLMCQARVVNDRGIMMLQDKITKCLQKMQRHMERIRILAEQNANFAQELRLCGAGPRADQRNRLGQVESELATRLSKFLAGHESFYDKQPLAGAASVAACVPPPGQDAAGGAEDRQGRADQTIGPSRPAAAADYGGGDVRRSLDKGKGDQVRSGFRADGLASGSSSERHHLERRPTRAPHDRRVQDMEDIDQCDESAGASSRSGADIGMGIVQDDEFAAASFLTTPPVAMDAATSARGARASMPAASTPAYSSMVSTPSTGSSSPALANASPPVTASRRETDRRVSIDRNREMKSSKRANRDSGRMPEHSASSQEHPSSLSSSTQPSTLESPLPAYSTQEGSAEADAAPDGNHEDEGAEHRYGGKADVATALLDLAVSGKQTPSAPILSRAAILPDAGQQSTARADTRLHYARSEAPSSNVHTSNAADDRGVTEREAQNEEDDDLADSVETVKETSMFAVGGGAEGTDPVTSEDEAWANSSACVDPASRVRRRRHQQCINMCADNSLPEDASRDRRASKIARAQSCDVDVWKAGMITTLSCLEDGGSAGADEAGGAETETDTGSLVTSWVS